MAVRDAPLRSQDPQRGLMNAELFGVFDDRDAFTALASPDAFHEVLSAPQATVGIRAAGLGIKGRTDVHEAEDGWCAVWGEAFTPDGEDRSTAAWVYDRFRAIGRECFHELNGSYVAAIASGDTAMVVPDMLRSRECFYADVDGTRVFGTDAAHVARTMPAPEVDTVGLNHFLHCGVVFEDRSLLQGLRCIPFDGYLTADGSGHLERVVYEPTERSQSEIANDLADRLGRAVARRSRFPQPSGILASAGFDSRLVMGTVDDLDVSYTLGTPTTPEVVVARRIAEQYGARHEILPVTGDYLTVTPEIIRYTNGVRESVHIHHRGNVDALTVRSIYHGLMLDTVLRDIYLPTRSMDIAGHDLPLPGLEADPDPFVFMQDRLGIYVPDDELLAPAPPGDAGDPTGFLRRAVTDCIEDCRPQADSVYNAMAMSGLKLKQALPFKTHLADNFHESMVAADNELIDWHLTTPPAYRNKRTFQQALDMINGDLLRHRPPDRPHRSHTLNEIEGFLRRHLPLVRSSGTPWPDRDKIYRANGLDHKLFPDAPVVHDLPPRVKLRIHDARTWLACATGRQRTTDELLTRG